MIYRVEYKPSAAKALASLARDDQQRLAEAIDALAKKPRPSGVEKMSERDAWKVRVGSYRIVYEIEDRALRILVLAVGDRRDVYNRLRK